VIARQIVALAAITHLRHAGATARVLLGGGPDQVPDRWAQADPIAVIPLDVPVLLVHPRDDATVSVLQSRAYAEAALELGADVTLVEPESGGHRAVIDPSSSAWRSVVDWLERRAVTPAGEARTPG
jgi:alpha-beta hydrolase superfamily lysophospholipase